MKVAVTGASGHIGNCLVRELLNRGTEVKVLLHTFENSINTLNVQIVRGNVLDTEVLNRLCENVDVVYHLAAKIAIDRREKNLVYKVNIEGTQNLVESCIRKKVKKLIHFSSIHAFNIQPLDQALDETRSW